jgi:hypothetical protein
MLNANSPMVDVSYHHLMAEHILRVKRAGGIRVVPKEVSAITRNQLKMHELASSFRDTPEEWVQR